MSEYGITAEEVVLAATSANDNPAPCSCPPLTFSRTYERVMPGLYWHACRGCPQHGVERGAQ